MLLLLVVWLVISWSSASCSVFALPVASSAGGFGGKRVLRVVSMAREDLGLVLSSPSSAAAAAAATVVVFSVGLVSLLAVPVTRLGSFVVDGMVASSFSTGCLLRWLLVYGRESVGIN